jgi:hypothetical protein
LTTLERRPVNQSEIPEADGIASPVLPDQTDGHDVSDRIVMSQAVAANMALSRTVEILTERLDQARREIAQLREREAQRVRGWIYRLTDPRDGSVRYVGQTRRSLPGRLAEHLSKPTNNGMDRWFRQLQRAGLAPAIEGIQQVDIEDLLEAESAQIFEHMREGHQLLNGRVPRYFSMSEVVEAEPDPVTSDMYPVFSPDEAKAALLQVIADFEGRGVTEIGTRDVMTHVERFGRSRPWTSRQLQILAEDGRLAPTPGRDRYRIIPVVNGI